MTEYYEYEDSDRGAEKKAEADCFLLPHKATRKVSVINNSLKFIHGRCDLFDISVNKILTFMKAVLLHYCQLQHLLTY